MAATTTERRRAPPWIALVLLGVIGDGQAQLYQGVGEQGEPRFSDRPLGLERAPAAPPKPHAKQPTAITPHLPGTERPGQLVVAEQHAELRSGKGFLNDD